MISDPNRVVQGIAALLGGANSSVDPLALQDSQFAWATNIVARGGYPTTRPGFKFLCTLPTGRIQGAAFFNKSTVSEIVCMIDGKAYAISEKNKQFEIKSITPTDETSFFISPKANLCQTPNYMVIQDGISRPLVYSGSSCSRSIKREPADSQVIIPCKLGVNNVAIAPKSASGITVGMRVTANSGIVNGTFDYYIKRKTLSEQQLTTLQIYPPTFVTSITSPTEVRLSQPCNATVYTDVTFIPPGPLETDISIPTGDISLFSNGRLWVARKNVLYAGDLAGSREDAEITFSENLYLSEGGTFVFDSDVTGLTAVPGADTSTGQGDLIVFTKKRIYAIKSWIYDRTTWQGTQGMQRVVFDSDGSCGHDSICIAAGDIYFRGFDGLRSLSQSLSGVRSSRINLSDSLEAVRVIQYDTQPFLEYCPSIYFDSRILMGAAPKLQNIYDSNGDFTGNHNVVFTKLLPLDFNVGEYVDKAPVAFDGEWTGLQISKLVVGIINGTRRAFAITCGPDGKNGLYEITMDSPVDIVPNKITGNPEELDISSSIELKRMDFGSPEQIKELYRADIGFSDTYGKVSWTAGYIPDNYPVFLELQSGIIEYENTTPSATSTPPSLARGYKNLRTVKPKGLCIPGTKRMSNFAYFFQPKINWTGHARLILFRLHANKKDISDLGEC